MNKNKVSILNGTEFNGVKIRCEIKSIPSLMDIDMGEFLEHARDKHHMRLKISTLGRKQRRCYVTC